MCSQPWPRSNNNNHIQSQLYESGAEERSGNDAWIQWVFSKRYQWTAHLLNCSFRTYTVTIWLWNGPQRPLCLDLLRSCWHYFGRTVNVSKVGCWGSELLEWVLEVWEPCLFLVHPMLPDFILTFNCKSTQTCSSFSCFLSSICSSIARRKATKTYA